MAYNVAILNFKLENILKQAPSNQIYNLPTNIMNDYLNMCKIRDEMMATLKEIATFHHDI